MAQIVTITNPLTGQPAQVDQLEHTAQEIDDAIARALPGGDIDITLQKKALKTPLEKYTLPGADAFNSMSEYAYYTKDQFGLVTVNIYGATKQAISAGVDTQIGLLPEGFRPAKQLSSCGWSQSGGAGYVPGAVWVMESGAINFRASAALVSGVYIFGQINFVAGE